MAKTLIVLSPDETKQLTFSEAVIERGQKTFIEVGNALASIRDGKLYRETHGTFADYCKEKWGYDKSHAYRMIDSAKVIENLSPIGDKNIKGGAAVLPETESQARPLTQLATPKEQAKVWANVVKESEKSGEPITAATVEAAVEKHLPKAPADEPTASGAPWEEPDGEPRTTKPTKSGKEVAYSDTAKAQIKIWYDTISRWLGQSPAIDEFRAAFPSPKADRALNAAKELYEALKSWHGAIK